MKLNLILIFTVIIGFISTIEVKGQMAPNRPYIYSKEKYHYKVFFQRGDYKSEEVLAPPKETKYIPFNVNASNADETVVKYKYDAECASKDLSIISSRQFFGTLAKRAGTEFLDIMTDDFIKEGDIDTLVNIIIKLKAIRNGYRLAKFIQLKVDGKLSPEQEDCVNTAIRVGVRILRTGNDTDLNMNDNYWDELDICIDKMLNNEIIERSFLSLYQIKKSWGTQIEFNTFAAGYFYNRESKDIQTHTNNIFRPLGEIRLTHFYPRRKVTNFSQYLPRSFSLGISKGRTIYSSTDTNTFFLQNRGYSYYHLDVRLGSHLIGDFSVKTRGREWYEGPNPTIPMGLLFEVGAVVNLKNTYTVEKDSGNFVKSVPIKRMQYESTGFLLSSGVVLGYNQFLLKATIFSMPFLLTRTSNDNLFFSKGYIGVNIGLSVPIIPTRKLYDF